MYIDIYYTRLFASSNIFYICKDTVYVVKCYKYILHLDIFVYIFTGFLIISLTNYIKVFCLPSVYYIAYTIYFCICDIYIAIQRRAYIN